MADLSKFQGYTMERVNRSSIELAYYNPRRISQGNRDRLKHGLSKHSLVVPLTLNKRTGRLVSGHQRLQILDEKHKGADYALDIAVIDVPESEEAALNILLTTNPPKASSTPRQSRPWLPSSPLTSPTAGSPGKTFTSSST